MKSDAGLEFAGQTDTRLVQSHNEDFVVVSRTCGFAILADGMGGCSAGELASANATSTSKAALEEGLDRIRRETNLHLHHNRQFQRLVVKSIQRVNPTVFEAARAKPQYNGMSTTLVAALFLRDKITVTHVSDFRAYRFRKGAPMQITCDHSLLQEQTDPGLVNPEWARFAQNKNLVTRAADVGPDMEIEIPDHPTEPDDTYL